MTLSSMASGPRTSRVIAGITRCLAASSLVLIASCGGGTTQSDPFVALRYFAFGDDISALTATGKKYSVNGVDSAGALDCTLQANWTQQMAGLYGFVFAECNPAASTEIKAKMYATVGAKVADVAAQVDAQVAAGGFRDKDLATVLAGSNDILALYASYPTTAEAALMTEARARGERLAQIVNRIIDLGGKVVVSNMPDMGLSPFALLEKAAKTDTDRAALLSRLSIAFNEQLGVKVLLDGRFVGLVQMDQRLQLISRNKASFGLSNVTEGVCAVALPDCTTATLVTGADANVYLWADTTRLSPFGQGQLASLALDRARRNPF